MEAAVCVLEDDPLFNAGRGSVLRSDGSIQMDAAIMDGSTSRAGAVCSIERIAHPISLARAVLHDGRHVLMAGEAALALADKLRIHPAIVAGRVRYETGNWRLLSSIKGTVRHLFLDQLGGYVQHS